jgi:hypothetical protein
MRFREPGTGELIVAVTVDIDGNKCKVKEQRWKVQVNATSINAFTHNLEFPDLTMPFGSVFPAFDIDLVSSVRTLMCVTTTSSTSL